MLLYKLANAYICIVQTTQQSKITKKLRLQKTNLWDLIAHRNKLRDRI